MATRQHSLRQWAPAVVAVVVVAGVAVAIPVAASASVKLPNKTPTQLVEFVQSSKVTAFSGDITETSDLGLPSLPSTGASGSSAAGGSSNSIASDLSLLTGSNSIRLYVDGPNNVRVQDLGSLSEQDVILHDSNIYTYDSKTNTVEHGTIAKPSGKAGHSLKAPSQSQRVTALTPETIANDLIAKLKTTSTVSTKVPVRVAGRAAYELVLTPKASDTLIGSITVAVDAQTGVPLQVQIDAAGQADPAISIGFTDISFETPSASLFDYKIPTGATVKQLTKPTKTRHVTKPGKASKADKPKTSVTGSGWDAVVSASPSSTGASDSSALAKLAKSPELAELTTATADGRVLHTTLFNVLFTTDGRIVAGAVPIARLEAVAAQ